MSRSLVSLARWTDCDGEEENRLMVAGRGWRVAAEVELHWTVYE